MNRGTQGRNERKVKRGTHTGMTKKGTAEYRLKSERPGSVLPAGDYKRSAGRPEGASRVKCFSTSRKRHALAADRWFAAFRIQRRGVPAASAHYCAAAVVVPHRQYRLGP